MGNALTGVFVLLSFFYVRLSFLRTLHGDRHRKAYPQHYYERALCGDGEFCVRAIPPFVHESERQPGEKHRIRKDEPAHKGIKRMSEEERQQSQEQPQSKGYPSVVHPDLRLARVVYGLDGIVLAEFYRVCDKHRGGAQEVDHKTYRGDRRRYVVFDDKFERFGAHHLRCGQN